MRDSVSSATSSPERGVKWCKKGFVVAGASYPVQRARARLDCSDTIGSSANNSDSAIRHNSYTGLVHSFGTSPRMKITLCAVWICLITEPLNAKAWMVDCEICKLASR